MDPLRGLGLEAGWSLGIPFCRLDVAEALPVSTHIAWLPSHLAQTVANGHIARDGQKPACGSLLYVAGAQKLNAKPLNPESLLGT